MTTVTIMSRSGRAGQRAFLHRPVEERRDGHGLQGRPQDVCQQRSDMFLLQSVKQRLEKLSPIPRWGFFFFMTQIYGCQAVTDFLSPGLTLGTSPWQP